MRVMLKSASVVCHPESEPQKKIALDTEQDSIPHPSVTCRGSTASGAHEQSPTARRTHDTIPSVSTCTDQNTSTGDATGEESTGPSQDVTRASSNDATGHDVVMREDGEDEKRAEDPGSLGSDSRRRITTKRGPREARDEQSSTTVKHVARRILWKTAPQERAVAVTTQGGTGRVP